MEIINISDKGRGKLTVRYRVTGPPPGRMVARAITDPCVPTAKSFVGG
ncbi:MAG: protease complex subunit PrcB family protein [Bacillota bacterium]